MKGVKEIGCKARHWLTAEQAQALWQAPRHDKLKNFRVFLMESHIAASPDAEVRGAIESVADELTRADLSDVRGDEEVSGAFPDDAAIDGLVFGVGGLVHRSRGASRGRSFSFGNTFSLSLSLSLSLSGLLRSHVIPD